MEIARAASSVQVISFELNCGSPIVHPQFNMKIQPLFATGLFSRLPGPLLYVFLATNGWTVTSTPQKVRAPLNGRSTLCAGILRSEVEALETIQHLKRPRDACDLAHGERRPKVRLPNPRRDAKGLGRTQP
ncbi:uncharacterized protein LOC132196506 [Neocloeon triangulifer]|uniref:uncharacterized protein LOC132196506 n=1 Tax=Neocloeon triangulifer TaxID=2078957 RepID=UPI00286F0EB5|nr:uncharacterized protein LOC132196506 [Neocloeon triangulifer]